MDANMLKNIWIMIVDSDLFTKFIILLIIIISGYSWAIMYRKFRRFKLIREQSEKILSFARGKTALQILKVKIKAADHPIARILNVMKQSVFGSSGSPDSLVFQEEINASITQILEYEERHIDFLATTSSVTPFLGLLGTVWGITDSFFQIGQQSSANIAVVAPGLSSALITTILGIIAAIPAFFGFNYFRGELRHLEGELESFAKTMMAKALREAK
ncbi:MAG: MotA/TolQ/ExbB proton channel family protein [Candidatus Zixiibacteriota bacterium]